MDNKEFNKLFELWKKEKMERAKDASPAKGKDCLFFTELEAYVKDGCEALSNTQKEHIQSCAHCQKMIAAFEKAMQEEKQDIPIYERLTQALENLVNILTFPLKALPRLAPALVPVLAVIFIFVMFSNQPLELKNYSLEFAPTIKTRAPQIPTEKIFRIQLVPNSDCYAYLFAFEENTLNLLAEEKISKKTTNVIPEEKWLKGEGKLILVLAKKPLKDISAVQESIIKNYNKNEKETLEILKRHLKRRDITLRFL